MKQAEEQLRVKKIVKSGAKTLEEKIDQKYKELLTKKILKNSLKQKDFFFKLVAKPSSYQSLFRFQA